MISLGDRVQCRLTGFSGIAVARTDWLYQCRRIGVQPEQLHEGKPIDVQWFDEDQLTVVSASVAAPPVVRTASFTGGPERPTSSRRDPAR